MADTYSAGILRVASAVIACHGSEAVRFAEKIAGTFRAPGTEDDARQWDLICAAIRAIKTAVPLPDLIAPMSRRASGREIIGARNLV